MNSFVLGYQKSPYGNVGDDLNPWLLQRLLPDIRFGEAPSVLLGIGSILVSERWDGYARKLVIGSGARSLARIPRLDESWDVRFVRGPGSAAALGVPHISDPALLIGRHAPPAPVRKGIGIVPYYRSNHRLWKVAAAQLGARVISPRLDVDDFVAALNGCERVFCEAMHGAIFADALRIPWRPISFQNIAYEGETHQFKWSDWVGSVELAFDPLVEPPDRFARARGTGPLPKLLSRIDKLRSSRSLALLLRRGIRDDAFVVSANDVFENRVERMAAEFERVNREGRR